MRNYLANSDFGTLHTQPDGSPLTEIVGITQPPPLGICPAWGHGPGGGAETTVRFADFAFWSGSQPAHPVPSHPRRMLHITWTKPLDPVHGADGSGWDQLGYPFRYDFLEHPMWQAYDLLGQWIGFEFYAAGGAPFTLYPGLWTNYRNNDFALHDMHIRVEIVPGRAARGYGFAYVPPPPVGHPVVDKEFYVGFSIGACDPNPPAMWLAGFKLWRVPAMADAVDREPPAVTQLRTLPIYNTPTIQERRKA